MPGPVSTTFVDQSLEPHALRRHGLLGRGGGMRNARSAIELIVDNGPFPYPGKDGTPFGNRFGDRPSGRCLECTVPTPGAADRGARRFVARLSTAQLYFTACHCQRVQVSGGRAAERQQARLDTTAHENRAWRNGFHRVTGLVPELRARISQAVKALG